MCLLVIMFCDQRMEGRQPSMEQACVVSLGYNMKKHKGSSKAPRLPQ